MMRMFRAIVWLRWRLLVGGIRGGTRRDTLEQISRIFATVLPLALAALTVGSLIATGLVGFAAGRAIARGPFEPPAVLFVVRIVLAAVAVLVVMIALASPAQTVLARYNRLLLLPIPRQLLHAVEVAANIFDPWIAFVIPGLMMMGVALALDGWPVPALTALVGGIAVVAVLASMAALFASLVGWLMRSRRRGEMFTLVFVLAISLLSFIPAAVSSSLESSGDESGGRRRRRGPTVAQIEAALPAWTRALPSELYGRALLHAVEGRTPSAGIALVGLVAEAGLFFLLSSVVHRRMLDSFEGDARRRRGTSDRTARRRLPLMPAPVSAVALAQMRGALRTVRGRTVVLLPGPMLAVLALLLRSMPNEERWLLMVAGHGPLLLAAGTIFSLYAMQAFTMNLFGSDRHGLSRHFLSPVSDADLAAGKLTGCSIVFAAAVGLCLAAAIAVAPTGALSLWIATLAGAAATYVLLSPVFVWLSALFPVAADLSKTGPGGNPHPLPMFGGAAITLAAALPAALIMSAHFIWDASALAALALMLGWLMVTLAVAMPLVGLASRTIGLRRENLATVAAGR
jgi:hypothetical protein